MKGIAHFVTGVAVGTFFPDAVQAAAAGSFVLVLGGVGGLLPDTLDFRLARFLEKPDVVIAPHPEHFEAQETAEKIAAAINQVSETKRKLILKCNTARVGVDWWRQYSIRFDVANRRVVVKLGPIVNTSQMPLPSSERAQADGRAEIRAPMLPTYNEFFNIDIFSGPSFAIEWRNERVEIDFLPWHRQWSHSLLAALLFGLICGVLFGMTAGLVGGLAVLAHILEDQLGYLGNNLFYPLTHVRSNGLGLIHADDAIPNLFTVGTAVMLILFNLDRYSPHPLIDPIFYWGVFWLPFPILLAYFFHSKFRSDSQEQTSLLTLRQADLLAETQEVVDA